MAPIPCSADTDPLRDAANSFNDRRIWKCEKARTDELVDEGLNGGCNLWSVCLCDDVEVQITYKT